MTHIMLPQLQPQYQRINGQEAKLDQLSLVGIGMGWYKYVLLFVLMTKTCLHCLYNATEITIAG